MSRGRETCKSEEPEEHLKGLLTACEVVVGLLSQNTKRDLGGKTRCAGVAAWPWQAVVTWESPDSRAAEVLPLPSLTKPDTKQMPLLLPRPQPLS